MEETEHRIRQQLKEVQIHCLFLRLIYGTLARRIEGEATGDKEGGSGADGSAKCKNESSSTTKERKSCCCKHLLSLPRSMMSLFSLSKL